MKLKLIMAMARATTASDTLYKKRGDLSTF